MFRIVVLIAFSILMCSCQGDLQQTKAKNEKPNIILILADDLGYGELGCYGQNKIETPNIDNLANEGMRFTQHYSGSPVCAPSRYILLTGKHSGHAYIRGNDEWTSRGDVWSYKAMIKDSTLEGQRPIPTQTQTIAKLLKKAGYNTGMIGKWGLGAPHTESIPNKMGFDYFLGYNCQRQAHTYYPVHLYENEKRLYLNNDTVAPHEKLGKFDDPKNPHSFDKYNLQEYSPDVMFRGMMNFIDENKDHPFFLYWATPIPHAPIQAPNYWVNYYRNKFGDEQPYLGSDGYFPHPSPRAGYAAMISYLDDRVGKLIKKLKEDGIYNNTLILFTSDNGPTYAGGVDAEYFNSAKPFGNQYGRTKGFVYEGGIRVPLIACWPGKIKPGSQSDHISAFYDLLPTLCDITDIDLSEEQDGISYLPAMLGLEDQQSHDYLYWEFPEYNGQQAVRMREWKAVRKNIKDGNLDIELYNLINDEKELNNIAAQNPEIVKEIGEIMIKSHLPSQIDRFKLKALGDN